MARFLTVLILYLRILYPDKSGLSGTFDIIPQGRKTINKILFFILLMSQTV